MAGGVGASGYNDLMPTLALLLLTLAPVPIDLDGISLDRARHLSGRLVVASFINSYPLETIRGRTMIGGMRRNSPHGSVACPQE